MKKPRMVILIGNIGSGKSTISRQFSKKNFIILSRDSLRYMIGAGDYKFDAKKTEPIIRKMNLACLREIAADKLNVLIDETSMSVRTREALISIGKSFGYYIVAVVMPNITMKNSVDRRMKSPHGKFGRKTWESVWKMFDSMYEPPTELEGFDKIIYL